MEQGHSNSRSVTTRYTDMKGHIKKAILRLFGVMSTIIRAQPMLLAAIDIECLSEY